MNKPAVGYIRVSSPANVGCGSEPRQVVAIRGYAERHGYGVFKFFEDRAVSARTPIDQREGFSRMLVYMETHHIKTILVERANRFSRGYEEFLRDYQIVNRKGLEIIFIREERDTFPTYRDIGIGEDKFVNLVAFHSGQEAEDISENTRQGRERKQNAGQKGVGRKDTAARYLFATVDARMLREKHPDWSLEQIGRELHAMGNRPFSRNGGVLDKPFDRTQVRRMLQD